MYGVFKGAKCAGHLDESLFDSWSLCCLNDLLSDPVEYAFRTQGQDGRDNLKSLLIRISNRFSSISVSMVFAIHLDVSCSGGSAIDEITLGKSILVAVKYPW